MKVSELAESLKITSDDVLRTLKSLKLKSKDKDQELSGVVISVVKSAVKQGLPKAPKDEKKALKDPVAKEKVVKKKAVAKKAVKKAATKTKDKKDATAKVVKKRVVKKKILKKRVVKKVSKKKTEETPPKPSVEETTTTSHVSMEPVINLKPLPRKKKRGGDRTDSSSDDSTQTTNSNDSNVGGAAPSTIDEKDFQDVEIQVPINVKDLSAKLGQKPGALLKELMRIGIFANINQGLDGEIVSTLAKAFGFNYISIKTQEEQVIEEHKKEEEDPSLLEARAPVITFMGHVDHGKTSLLDYIRKSKVADREHGGITQHMGAYSVTIEKGRITFLDTPGHEAFTAMRARGAHITDIVVLVVAADEGIKPQTEEAIDHARAAGVPIVVALNKIDRANANLDMVKKQLAEHDLASEDWGGKTVVCGVSALTGAGVDELLELILLEAELLELRANPNKKASGIVVEAHLSKGKGAVVSLIVQSGTLKTNDFIVAGPFYGKVRAMLDDHGRNIKEAGPSMPVEVLGFTEVPEAGENFYVLEDERTARDICLKRQAELKDERLNAKQKLTLEGLYSQIAEGSIKELNVVIKSDVQGSLEALKDSLAKIPSDRVKLKFIHSGLGDVNTSDVLLAYVSKAIIIAFHVGIQDQAKKELEKDPVDIRQYRIIYDAVEDMHKALEGLLEAKEKKTFISRAEVREVFNLTKRGKIAGCYVQKGKVNRKATVDVIREDEIIFSGNLSSLKRFKDDVKEVTEGMECGIAVEGFSDYQKGDLIEAYHIEKIVQRL